jgi:hypothetical protein
MTIGSTSPNWGLALASRQVVALLILLVMSVTPSVWGAESLAVEFEAQGELTYRSFQQGTGKLKFSITKKFTIAVKGSEWLIRTWNANDTDNPKEIVQYNEVASDGTDVYSLMLFDTKKLPARSPEELRGKKQIHSVGEVYTAPLPIPDFADVSHFMPIWTAFASTGYLGGVTNDQVKPFWSVQPGLAANRQYFIRAEWNRKPEFPGLLEQMTFHSNGRNLKPNPGGTSDPYGQFYPRPFDKGFVRAVYQATNFTNFGGLTLPQRFTFTSFNPKWGARTNTALEPWTAYNGVVQYLGPRKPTTAMLPAIPAETLVTDARIRNLAPGLLPINYMLTNKWFKGNDPALVKMLSKMAERAPGSPAQQAFERKRYSVLMVLGGFAIVFAFVWMWYMFRGEQQS